MKLRLRMAWAVLRGRSVAYRVNATVYYGHVTLALRTGSGFVVECWVWDDGMDIRHNSIERAA